MSERVCACAYSNTQLLVRAECVCERVSECVCVLIYVHTTYVCNAGYYLLHSRMYKCQSTNANVDFFFNFVIELRRINFDFFSIPFLVILTKQFFNRYIRFNLTLHFVV